MITLSSASNFFSSYRIEQLDFLDEKELLTQLLQHYCLTCGYRDQLRLGTLCVCGVCVCVVCMCGVRACVTVCETVCVVYVCVCVCVHVWCVACA